jgi:hypothetical protein
VSDPILAKMTDAERERYETLRAQGYAALYAALYEAHVLYMRVQDRRKAA